MGKRKKTLRSQMKNKGGKLKMETLYSCPICMHHLVVKAIRISKTKSYKLTCMVCESSYVNVAKAPIDCYSMWVDDLEKDGLGYE